MSSVTTAIRTNPRVASITLVSILNGMDSELSKLVIPDLTRRLWRVTHPTGGSHLGEISTA